jgi:hypothetical protein
MKTKLPGKPNCLDVIPGTNTRTQFGARVVWEFIEVLDLVQLSNAKIEHGSEVYSQFLDEKDLIAIRRSLTPGKLGEETEA